MNDENGGLQRLEQIERQKIAMCGLLDACQWFLAVGDMDGLPDEELRTRLNLVGGCAMVRRQFDQLVADFADGQQTLEETYEQLAKSATDAMVLWRRTQELLHLTGLPPVEGLDGGSGNDTTPE